MSGVSSSAAQHAGEELVFDNFLSSPFVEDSGGTIEALLQVPVYLPLKRPIHNARAALPFVAAIVFLLLFMYVCSSEKNSELAVKSRLRRLSGNEGKEKEKDAGSKTEGVCGMVEEAVSFQGAEQTALPEPSPAATKAVFEEERPRKKKMKTRWLEQESLPAALLNKKAREGKSSMFLQLQGEALERSFYYDEPQKAAFLLCEGAGPFARQK